MIVYDGPKQMLAQSDESQKECYAYDIRTNEVYLYRRLNAYVLLRTLPFNTLHKVSLEDFDEFFEGTPEPSPPLLMRTK